MCLLLTRVPTSFGRLVSLSDLSLDGSEITVLPDFISSLTGLRRVSLSSCVFLTKLPETIGRLSLLEILILKKTDIRSLPVNIGLLFHLQTLDLESNDRLEIIPALPGSLNTQQPDKQPSLVALNVSSCKKVRTLPSLSNLTMLKILDAGGCTKLEELVGLGELEALEILTISGCKEIEKLPDLSKLKQLEAFNACGCEKLCQLSGLDNLEKLKILFVGGCKEIEWLPDLSKLVKLESLSIWGCEKLPAEWVIENEHCLQRLRLYLRPPEIPEKELQPDPLRPPKPDDHDFFDVWGHWSS